ncbi:MAG TPA: hypothetical protein EYN67_03700 [Flavobacteriales bacterium]|nr:hypothetical protein [Flavobacteriales bacterium]
MKVGDLVCLCPVAYPDTIGVVTQILIRDQYGDPLDIKVLHNGQIDQWEADEAAVISENR